MILIVDNGGQYVHRIYRSLRYLGVPSKIVANSISPEDIGEDVKGIIIGGGPDIERASRCIDIILNAKVPLLGICLGHQLICKAYGGVVGRAEMEEYAYTKIYVKEENDIFRNIPREFTAWASHRDEVKVPPKDFKVLAYSDICDVEAMKHVEKPIYGVQFHPEVSHTEYGPEILKNFCNVCGLYKG